MCENGGRFWGGLPGARNCPGGALMKKAPQKRGPARNPETAGPDTKDEHSFTVWTSNPAWHGPAADPLPGSLKSPTRHTVIWTNLLILGGVFGDTPGRANVWIWSSFWWGSPGHPFYRPGGASLEKAPPKRGPARDPATSPLDTKDAHSFTVWTSIRAWHSSALGDGRGGG